VPTPKKKRVTANATHIRRLLSMPMIPYDEANAAR